MDRRRQVVTLPLRRIWAAALVAAACSSAPQDTGPTGDAPPKASDIRSLRWLADGKDRVKFLTELPAACETPAAAPEQAEQRLRGKIAFESPALLGGTAARMELACASCHRNGRGNPDFFLEGLSDKPGTADVTSSVMSKVRGDGNFNPVVIPDIAMRDGHQIKDRTGAEFRAKVHGLVEQEFDGQVPPPAVTDAVIAYLDGLAPSACVAGAPPVPFDLGYDLDAAEAAWTAAADPKLDEATRLFYLRVARLRLARIFERFVGPDLAPQRREVLSLSSRLGEMAATLRAGQIAAFTDPDWKGLRESLNRVAAKSLYNPDIVRAAFAQE